MSPPARRISPAHVIVASVALAALSLLGPRALAFDPAAWLIWGEQLARLELDTTAGPSWKPLPVVVTAPLTFTGDAAPALWLLVARAGAILALVGIAALAWRLGGRTAAVAAAALVLVSPWWWYNAALGNSEGLLAAVVSWSAVAHLAGRIHLSLLAGLLGAAIRPEVAAFFFAYCGLVALHRPEHRVPAAAAAVAAAAAWLGPDLAGAGGVLSSAESSRGWASPGSAQSTDDPARTVVLDAVRQMTVPVAVAAATGVVLAFRGRPRRPPAAIGALALGYVGVVAALTAAGYAGNPRYLVPATALGTALAAAGIVCAGVRATSTSRAGPGAAAILVGLVAVLNAPNLAAAAADVSARARWSEGLSAAIERAGGADVVRRCGRVRTAGPWRALVAYRLDMPLWRVTSAPAADSVVVVPPIPPFPRPRTEDRTLLARTNGWEVWHACGSGAESSP